MEFGLDNGTELDTEKVETPSNSDLLENPIVPGQAPEITEQNTIVAAMESQAISLALLIDDIQSVGGMNRAMAMEAIRIVPDFGSVPLNRYSEFPTATRYQVSLESLSDTLRNFIKKIVDLIKKAIDYVIFKITGKAGQKADMSIVKLFVEKQRMEMARAKAAAIDAEESMGHIYHAVDNFNEHIAAGIDTPEHNFQNVVDVSLRNTPSYRRAHELLKSGNQVIADLASRGKYTKFLFTIPSALIRGTEDIVLRCERLKKVFEQENFSEADFVQVANDVKKPITFINNGNTYYTEDAYDLLNSMQNRLPQAKPVENIDVLFKTTREMYENNEVEKFSEELGQVTFNLIMVRKAVEDLSDHVAFFERKHIESRVVNESAIAAVSYIQKQVSSIALTLNFLNNYHVMVTNVAFDVHRIVGKVYKTVRSLYTEAELKDMGLRNLTRKEIEQYW